MEAAPEQRWRRRRGSQSPDPTRRASCSEQTPAFSPRDSIPIKRWGGGVRFLIKLKSVTLCFLMTDPCGFPPEMEESGTW